jgi:uncharacterized membrane protein YfcA
MPIKVSKIISLNHSQLAFLYAVPIGILGGLIGLGGAEFRLPVLSGVLKYSVHEAVPLNLAISLVTITSAIIIRAKTLSFTSLIPLIVIIISLISGAVMTAFWGAGLAIKLSKKQLEKLILWLLIVIGSALIIEAFLPQQIPALIPTDLSWRIVTGIIFGLAIGLVSSLLGVAGGELIIPTLIFAFGVDIKTAGTGSLIISLPTVLVGIIRYYSLGAFKNQSVWSKTVTPMSFGSVIGAIIGGMLVGIISPFFLKLFLGAILIFSAFRVFRHTQSS